MTTELSNRVFEWLLANWAGYGENPAELFPSLHDADYNALQEELASVLQATHPPQQTIKTASR